MCHNITIHSPPWKHQFCIPVTSEVSGTESDIHHHSVPNTRGISHYKQSISVITIQISSVSVFKYPILPMDSSTDPKAEQNDYIYSRHVWILTFFAIAIVFLTLSLIIRVAPDNGRCLIAWIPQYRRRQRLGPRALRSIPITQYHPEPGTHRTHVWSSESPLVNNREIQSQNTSFWRRLFRRQTIPDYPSLDKQSQNSFTSGDVELGRSFSLPECPVCLRQILMDDEIRVPHCGHIAHRKCLDKWLLPRGNSDTCPMCRAVIAKPPTKPSKAKLKSMWAYNRLVTVEV
ncbi:hypothetical protein QBC38DRAFT_259382 [Podospora fimiseda]|uniref:RING-type domain-containing protein n=1 Tax=Podospora fimiseda TaxID=252190 RepID=A0AAN7H3J0_9PEZI|nr:hypothetical protein QBC38DRAFT_259382 [Podospora fimiseda]